MAKREYPTDTRIGTDWTNEMTNTVMTALNCNSNWREPWLWVKYENLRDPDELAKKIEWMIINKKEYDADHVNRLDSMFCVLLGYACDYIDFKQIAERMIDEAAQSELQDNA